jgi:hypothetical protein
MGRSLTRRAKSRGSSHCEPSPLNRPPRTKRSQYVIAISVYLALALLLWANVWLTGNVSHAITCNCGDTVEQVWWLEWLPWALVHGHNPFLTNAIFARLGGVNAMSNTSWFTPALLLSPITLLFGPVASYNVANLLAPILSGWAAFGLAGRFSRRTGSRLVAGALFAFSPYVLKNTMLGHINLTLTAYLPLTIILVLRLLESQNRPVRTGLLLGLLTIGQFFLGFEVIALTALAVALFALGVVLMRRDVIVAAWRHVLIGASSAVALSVVVLAYPLWFYVDGPRHVVGPYWKVTSGRPWMIINAGRDIFTGNGALRAVGYLGARGPNTMFLGVGIVLFIIVSAWFWWRRRALLIVAGVAVVCWLLEFVDHNWWAAVPIASSIVLARFALPVSLCAALLMCASIDGWWSAIVHSSRARASVVGGLFARVGVVAIVMLAFVPLVVTYTVPLKVVRPVVPLWFRQDAATLPSSTAVLTMPFAYGVQSRPMAWQAETNMSFNLIGGWAFVPGANGVNDEIMSPLRGAIADLRTMSGHPRRLRVAEQRTIRAAILRWRPVVVVVVPHFASTCSEEMMQETIGLLPRLRDGSWVWAIGTDNRLGALRERSAAACN